MWNVKDFPSVVAFGPFCPRTYPPHAQLSFIYSWTVLSIELWMDVKTFLSVAVVGPFCQHIHAQIHCSVISFNHEQFWALNYNWVYVKMFPSVTVVGSLCQRTPHPRTMIHDKFWALNYNWVDVKTFRGCWTFLPPHPHTDTARNVPFIPEKLCVEL